MIQKIDLSKKYGNKHISILYPGNAIGLTDTGIGSIGRIDQADINGGTTIEMHPHANDEILSYFRLGKVIHTDSSKTTETISRKKLMLMKAGKVFYHEENIIDKLEGLQIFIRPQTVDYAPEVTFYDLEQEDSLNMWRLIASNANKTPLVFTSETAVFDMALDVVKEQAFPEFEMPNKVLLLYAFQGNILVNGCLSLSKGECIITDEENTMFSTTSGAEVVLFMTNKDQNCFKDGMFSGNKG